jgi:ribose 5-phosphate isomerase A
VRHADEIHAVAADRFVVIADSSKPVEALHAPVPLELLAFGLRATWRLVPKT